MVHQWGRWAVLLTAVLLLGGVFGAVVVSAQSPELVNVPSQIQVGQTRHVQVRGVSGTAAIATSSTAVIRFESCAASSPVSSIQRQNDGLLSLTACTAGTASITLAVDGATVATYSVQATAGGASGAQALPGPRLSTPIRVDATTALLAWTSVNGATGYKVEWFRNDSWDTATNLANVTTNTAQMVWVGAAPEYVRVQSLPGGGFSNIVAVPEFGEPSPTGECPFGYVLDPIGKRCVWIREPVPEYPPTPTPGPGTPTAVPTPTLTPVPCLVNIDGPTVMRSGVNVFFGVTFTGEDQSSATWLTWTLPTGMRAETLTVNQTQVTVHWLSPLAISTGEIRVDMDCAGGGTTNATKNVESHPHVLFDIDAPVAPRNLMASTNETQTTITLTWVPGEAAHQLSQYEVYWDFIGAGGAKDEVLLLTTGNPRLLAAPAACAGNTASMCVTVDVSEFLVRRFHTFRVKTRVSNALSAASNTAGALAGPERTSTGDPTGMCPPGYAIDAVANRCVPEPTPTPVPIPCSVIIDGPRNLTVGQEGSYRAYHRGGDPDAVTRLQWTFPSQLTARGFTRNADNVTVVANADAIDQPVTVALTCPDGSTVTAQNNVTIVAGDPTQPPPPTPPPGPASLTATVNGAPVTVGSESRPAGTVVLLEWDVVADVSYEVTWFHTDAQGNKTEVSLRAAGNPRLVTATPACNSAQGYQCQDVTHFLQYGLQTFRVYATANALRSQTFGEASAYAGPAEGDFSHDPDGNVKLPAPRWLTATANEEQTTITLSWATASMLGPTDYQVYWDWVDEHGNDTEVLLRDTGNPRLTGAIAQCTGGSPGDLCVTVDVSDFLDRRFHTFRVRAYKDGRVSDPSPTAGAVAGPAGNRDLPDRLFTPTPTLPPGAPTRTPVPGADVVDLFSSWLPVITACEVKMEVLPTPLPPENTPTPNPGVDAVPTATIPVPANWPDMVMVMAVRVVELDTDSVILNWTRDPVAEMYEIREGAADGTPGTVVGTMHMATWIKIAGLTAATEYTYFVRGATQRDDGLHVGDWGMVTFTTLAEGRVSGEGDVTMELRWWAQSTPTDTELYDTIPGLDYWEVWFGEDIISDYGEPTNGLWALTLPADGNPREYRVRGVAQGGPDDGDGRRLPNGYFIPAGETHYTAFSENYTCEVPESETAAPFEPGGMAGEYIPGEAAPIAVALYKSLRALLAMDDGSDPDAGTMYMFWLVLTLIIAGALAYGGYKVGGPMAAAALFAIVFIPMWSIGGPTMAGVDWRAALPLTGVVIPAIAGMMIWRRGLRI